MKEQINKLTNFSFGGTSAIITNVSLIVGLGSTDVPRSSIIGGILIIAVADNISDSLGIHVYKESESPESRASFVSTILNFITRLLLSLSFVFIVLVFPARQAQLISIIWGLFALSIISYFICLNNSRICMKGERSPYLEILRHIGVAVIVIIASKYIGNLIHGYFEVR